MSGSTFTVTHHAFSSWSREGQLMEMEATEHLKNTIVH